jgi:hypothetical protein
MADVFLSYAKEDVTFAEVLAKALEECGFSVWWDRRIPPGQSFDVVIQNSLDGAQSAVVLWSKTSVASRWVKNEAARAQQSGKLVPALIDTSLPPLAFADIEAVQLHDWKVGEKHPEFDLLIETLATRRSAQAPAQRAAKPVEERNPQTVREGRSTTTGELTLTYSHGPLLRYLAVAHVGSVAMFALLDWLDFEQELNGWILPFFAILVPVLSFVLGIAGFKARFKPAVWQALPVLIMSPVVLALEDFYEQWACILLTLATVTVLFVVVLLRMRRRSRVGAVTG